MAKKSNKKLVQVKTQYGYQLCKLEPDEHGYIITAPGLPGVVTWGKSINHAKRMAREAIELCIECLVNEMFLGSVGKRIGKHVEGISKIKVPV